MELCPWFSCLGKKLVDHIH